MPKYPKKKLAQLLMQACIDHGIEQVVISPGSRNAPLTLGFVNHPGIKAYSIVDERCAAFFALGMAQQSRKPVALLCTSGSALLNYYPAIAEAYYSKIPLVVISADRPRHLIDIGDGQTIRQAGAFSNHISYETNLESEDGINDEVHMTQILSNNAIEIDKALQIATGSMGPVHINIPFDEPLYETVDHLYDFDSIRVREESGPVDSLLKEMPLPLSELEKFAAIWNGSERKMVLIGSNFPDELLQTQMEHLSKDPSVIILTETTSNVTHKNFIHKIDQLIFPLDNEGFEELKPEILLTFGGMIVSKKIKQFLRKFRPKEHWHVDSHGAMDTYLSLTHHFGISAQLFFSQFFFLTENRKSSYQKQWLLLKEDRHIKHEKFVENAVYSDLKVLDKVLSSLPQNTRLQLSNSSIIRYAQLFNIDPSIKVFCNRGASGIDGSTSTALGAALLQKGQTVLITGDISFLYDSNALWNSYIPDDFRIIIINNSGGGIFRFIPGPKSSDALDFFETPHNLDASALCTMYDFEYHTAENEKELEFQLKDFYAASGKPALLEIFTPRESNDQILGAYFKGLK
ncbi:2-succinyl-5-enolpyruvyl-6-hydroxy-3-cyclohexene-1-carboxylic-acid synthase [Lutimonas sp.]|uniref:2-succinyl-5-enolpyruvyl-6-hydroxy-3- cyclohexene-1-carboxylic-acid synthase n=1 Tax=Lutimonas sp. TaxID=1872403 RepID=UPI003C72FD28